MKELSTDKKPLHFVQLDTLRFLAAFIVVISHAWDGWLGWYGLPGILTTKDGGGLTWTGQRMNCVVHNLNIGVNMFFLISGFLITFLLLKEKSEKGKVNIPSFFLRRILRIWPLYFFIVAIAPFLVWWLQQSDPRIATPAYLPVIFFYNNFHTISINEWQFPFAHFWSVCIEEHFYLFWPFLVALFPIKKLPMVFMTVIAGSIALQIYGYFDHWLSFQMYLNTFARIDVLAIGGLAGWLHFHRPYKLQLPLLVRMILLLLTIIILAFTDLAHYETLFGLFWKKYVMIALMGILMMNYTFSDNVFFKWGPKHIVNYLGRCCFGIYLWGNILLQIIIQKIINYNPRIWYAPWWAYWPLVIGISLIVPVISYELIEKPFLKLKGKFAIIKTRV